MCMRKYEPRVDALVCQILVYSGLAIKLVTAWRFRDVTRHLHPTMSSPGGTDNARMVH